VRHVGPLPDEINEHFLNALPYAYLYEIFRAYTSKSVKVRDLMGPVGPPYTTVSGLNDAQLEHIYALFGTAAHRQRDQRIIEKQQQVLVDAVVNAVRAKSGQRRTAWSATMAKIPRLSQPSISNPKDLVSIWRAAYRVEYVGGGV
jgi:hypothetical protein